jgi:hypothetical protein
MSSSGQRMKTDIRSGVSSNLRHGVEPFVDALVQSAHPFDIDVIVR